MHYKQMDLDGTSLLTSIAIMALNTDITMLDPDWKDPLILRKKILDNKFQYFIDYRYRQLVKTVLQLIRQGENLTEEKILQSSGIVCLKRSHDNLTNMHAS